MESSVKGHQGIISLTYTPVTKSILVYYGVDFIHEQEIIVRVALSLSRDYELTPVKILSKPVAREMSGFAAVSGFILAATLMYRVFSKQSAVKLVMSWVSTLSVAGAVFEHAWSELQKHGRFDPEVLSIVYLITSIPRGNLLPAALFTWIATFGRHLVKLPAEGLEMKAVEVSGSDRTNPHYEVMVSPEHATSPKVLLFRMLPSLLLNAFSGGKAQAGGELLQQVRDMQKLHGETLEGLGSLRQGITLKIL